MPPPPGHELIDAILHEDRFGPRPLKNRVTGRAEPRTAYRGRPGQAIDNATGGRADNASDTTRKPTRKQIWWAKAATCMQQSASWGRWIGLVIFGICLAVWLRRGSAANVMHVDRANVQAAVAHLDAAKIQVANATIGSSASILSSLDDVLNRIVDMKPPTSILSQEIGSLAPQVGRLVDAHKNLSCSLVRPLHDRMHRASEACRTTVNVTSSSVNFTYTALNEIDRSLRFYKQEASDITNKNMWKLVTRLGPATQSNADGDQLKHLSAVQAHLASAKTETVAALHLLRSEHKKWDASCQQLGVLARDAAHWLATVSRDNPHHCLSADTLSAIRDKLAAFKGQLAPRD